MKKISFLGAFIVCAYLTNAQNGESWYKTFTGNAGTLATTLHLHKSGKNFSGYVWFEKNQTPMQIYSYPVDKTDSIMVSGSSGTVSFIMTGVFTKTSFAGSSRLQKEGSPPKQAGFLLQVNNEKSFTPCTYFFAEGKDSMPAQYKNYSQFKYFSSSVWPAGNMPLDESLKKNIRQLLDMKTTTVETGKFITDGKNKLLKEWKAYYIKLTPKETAGLGMSLSHWEENKILVMHENEKLISLAKYYFKEAGGQIHGEFNTTVTTISKETGKHILLSDVLNTQGINLLPSILEQVARVMYGAKNNKPLDQNGFTVNKILPTKNMYVTGSGIGFIYAPYEIKSFSDGEINLLVPFAALKPYLLPGFN